MKSKISCFNRGISQNLLRRFWPLWTSYFCMLLLLLPGNLSSQTVRISTSTQVISFERIVAGMDLSVVHEGITVVYISAFVGVIAAMAMFHYLYQSKSCGLINSLPVRRETVFLTAWLTGLVPLLLADLLAVLIAALLFCTRGLLHFSALLNFLALATLGNIAFYGFAVFCAMLTGNLLVLPAVYAVLNFAVAAAESCARELLSFFVFGMFKEGSKLQFLSPPVLLMERLGTTRLQPYGYQLNGLGVLGAYCAAGLLLSTAALLLYRRRRMETAGDVVAIRFLKPVFKYCLCFGTALVLADLLLVSFYQIQIRGLSAALAVLGTMLIGAFIGYFAAEMLIQKTLKVFRGKWRGFIVACAVIAVFVGVYEFDLTGYERRVPSPEDVEFVSFWAAGGEITETKDPVQINEMLDFHRTVIADKAECEAEASDCGVTIFYQFSDGRVLKRAYLLPTPGKDTAGSLVRRAELLLNSQEAILARVRADRPFKQEQILNASIQVYDLELEKTTYAYDWEDMVLTAEEAMRLYREGILPDAEAGQIELAYLIRDERYYDNNYPISIGYRLRDPGPDENLNVQYLEFRPQRDSVNTLKWLRENKGIEPKTYAELGID